MKIECEVNLVETEMSSIRCIYVVYFERKKNEEIRELLGLAPVFYDQEPVEHKDVTDWISCTVMKVEGDM